MSIAIDIAEVCVIVFLFYKYKAQAVLITLLQAKGADSFPTPGYNPFLTSTTLQTTTTPNQLGVNSNPILYVLLTIGLSFLIFKIWQLIATAKPHATICLEFTNGLACLTLPVVNVHCCPKFIHFQATKPLGDFNVKGRLRPKLVGAWGDLLLTNKVSQTTISLPPFITLSPLEGFKLRSIMQDKYEAFIICHHGQYAYHAFICNNPCTSCVHKLT